MTAGNFALGRESRKIRYFWVVWKVFTACCWLRPVLAPACRGLTRLAWKWASIWLWIFFHPCNIWSFYFHVQEQRCLLSGRPVHCDFWRLRWSALVMGQVFIALPHCLNSTFLQLFYFTDLLAAAFINEFFSNTVRSSTGRLLAAVATFLTAHLHRRYKLNLLLWLFRVLAPKGIRNPALILLPTLHAFIGWITHLQFTEHC